MILRITKRVPAKHKTLYNGCCLAGGEFYFGWKDRSATIYPVGQAVQKAIILLNNGMCTNITLIVEKEFSDSGKEEQLHITK
jgi:hypothetical protein